MYLKLTPSWDDDPAVVVDKIPFVIGRAPDCDLSHPSPWISRHHCELDCNQDRIVVRDLDSMHGLHLNGHRVEGECELHDGDRLLIGFVPFDVHIQSARRRRLTRNWRSPRSASA